MHQPSQGATGTNSILNVRYTNISAATNTHNYAFLWVQFGTH